LAGALVIITALALDRPANAAEAAASRKDASELCLSKIREAFKGPVPEDGKYPAVDCKDIAAEPAAKPEARRPVKLASSEKPAANDPTDDKEKAPKLYGIWGSLGPTKIRKTDNDGGVDGHVLTGTFGIDRWVMPKLLLGVTVGFEETDLTLDYNSGSMEGHGKTLSAYGGYIILPWLIADASFGYTWIDYDIVTNRIATSQVDARRWAAATNLTAIYRDGRFGVDLGVGFLAFDEFKENTEDSTGRYVESNLLAMRQVNAGIGAQYSMTVEKTTVTLKADAKFGYDVVRPSGSPVGVFGGTSVSTVDPSSVVFSAGFDVTTPDNVATAGFRGHTTQFQENTETYGFTASLRIAF
jgi:hypothetical protein